jgi:hypothetical protein
LVDSIDGEQAGFIDKMNYSINMKKPDNIDVRELFPELFTELIELLSNLSAAEWNYATSSSDWSVKDIAAHLVDTNFRRISFQRDKLIPPKFGRQIENYKQLVEYLNYLNNAWVEISERFSPGLLIDLLNFLKIEIPKLYDSLDMNGEALFGVSWAGEDKSENWFDIAREYSENWYHQQQIREAVGKPLLTEEKWVHPLIDTFVRGLPNLYQNAFPDMIDATVFLHVENISNGTWILQKNNVWKLYVGVASGYSSKITLNADTAWRIFSKNISIEEAKRKIVVEGDRDLGFLILQLTAFIK